MASKTEIADKRYGRLVGVDRVSPRNGRSFGLFRCDCGTEKEISIGHAVGGRIRSCGCLLNDVLHSEEHRAHCAEIAKLPKSHGMCGTPTYHVWKAMHQRCSNPNAHDYRWYGALGVRVCERWSNYKLFHDDMGDANGLTLDRENPFGDYEPDNCRWVTWEVQRANKRKDYDHNLVA